jgi:hypothetical protein
MKKTTERINVITESENKNFVHAIINAVTKGYSDRIVLDDIIDLVRRKEISKGILLASPDALRTYGESFKASLFYLADNVENLEVHDELTVNMKEKKQDENIVEDELEKIEQSDLKQNKQAYVKFANLIVSEDFEKYAYNELTNKMSGVFHLKFNENLDKHKNDNELKMSKEDVDSILNKIFSYCKIEYKNLKAELNVKIFKSNIKFSPICKDEADVEYEILGAF